VIIRNILNLDSRGFAPGLASVEDIANYILKSREGGNALASSGHIDSYNDNQLLRRVLIVFMISKGPYTKILS
jgi:hypothetical protein